MIEARNRLHKRPWDASRTLWAVPGSQPGRWSPTCAETSSLGPLVPPGPADRLCPLMRRRCRSCAEGGDVRGQRGEASLLPLFSLLYPLRRKTQLWVAPPDSSRSDPDLEDQTAAVLRFYFETNPLSWTLLLGEDALGDLGPEHISDLLCYQTSTRVAGLEEPSSSTHQPLGSLIVASWRL